MAEVTIWGLHPEAVALAWSLRRRGADVVLVHDGGDLLAGFGGATRVEIGVEIEEMLAELDPELHIEECGVATSFGTERQVNVAHRALLRLAQKRVSCVSFIGWREWSAATIAEGIGGKAVMLQLFGSPMDASFAQMQQRMADVVFRAEVVKALRGAEAVLMPPILGETSTGVRVQEALAAELGLATADVGCAVPAAASPLGVAHLQRVEQVMQPLRDPVIGREGDRLSIAGRTGPILAYGYRARARVQAWQAVGSLPLSNVAAMDAPRSLGDAWSAGLKRGAAWPL